MEYFAGLDVSMGETHICVLDREGALIREGKTRSSPAAIAAFLDGGPPCEQVVLGSFATVVSTTVKFRTAPPLKR